MDDPADLLGHNYDLYEMIKNQYFNMFWRNRYKLGLYTIDDVKKAGL